MSWHGPSAPRVEGIATKSPVVARCASKPASTASRILRLVSGAFICVRFPVVVGLHGAMASFTMGLFKGGRAASRRTRRDDQNHTLPDFADVTDRFQNRVRTNTLHNENSRA